MTRIVTGWLLAILTFAQLINVAQACLLEAARPAMAFVTAPCPMGGEQESMSPNVCLSQCLQADQSSSSTHFALPSAPLVAVLIVPEARVNARPTAPFSRIARHGGTGPPPPIRFCSLLL
jgi:hypothetical protein